MATVPSQSTVAVAQRSTAALWNDDVRDAVNFLLQEPYGLAYASGSTSMTTATWTVIAHASEEADTDVMHDNATNNSRVIAKTAGLYLLNACLVHSAVNTTGYRRMQVRKNAAGAVGSGTAVVYSNVDQTPSASVVSVCHADRVIPLAANDYVEMFGYQSSGGNNGLGTGSEQTYLQLTRLYT